MTPEMRTATEAWEPGWARFLYRRVARIYDWIRPLWSCRVAEARLDALFAERIGAATRVLELAPGTGINLDRLFRRSPEFDAYLGIDISPAMLARARRAGAGDPRVELRIGDATDLTELTDLYGFIVCTWLLSHLDDPVRTVRGALEHLAPGGTAAFLFFTRPSNLLARAVVGLFVRSFRGRFVDGTAVAALPNCESIHHGWAGYATLIVFHRPPTQP